MRIAVLGHRGMLGRRVLERFPDALTFDVRYTGAEKDPLLSVMRQCDIDWVVNCIGCTKGDDVWLVNATLPHRLAHEWRLIQPSTDHVWDDTEYARSKRLGEVGHVIRCAIVDPEGGMLARAREHDTVGEMDRQWNGITAKAWADVAADIIEGHWTGTVIPGSPTISHYELLETARRVFGWQTRTIRSTTRIWWATPPSLMLEPIETQLRRYLPSPS